MEYGYASLISFFKKLDQVNLPIPSDSCIDAKKTRSKSYKYANGW